MNEPFLKYKSKNLSDLKDKILVTKLHDNNLTMINHNIIKSIDNLSSKYPNITADMYKLVNRMQPNIGAITINNIFSYMLNIKPNFYKKCYFLS